MGRRFVTEGVGLLAALTWGAGPEAAVTVRFVEPQRYTDAGGYGGESERSLATLERHLVGLGSRCLKTGQSLDLSITDVDLAGRKEWWHGPAYDLRVMRDITWPRMDIEYVWHDGTGALLGQGRERVADMTYLWRAAYIRNDSEALPHERAMLRDWFERRFCPKTG